MAIDERAFKQLNQRAQQARTARDNATGQLEAVMTRLRDEFGCETLAAAEKKAAILTKDASLAEAEFEEAVTAFEEEWHEHLTNE